MKAIRKLTTEEMDKLKEDKADLFDALGDMDNATYCDTCDGLRLRGHTCKPWWDIGDNGTVKPG